jgi:hypothetical protein
MEGKNPKKIVVNETTGHLPYIVGVKGGEAFSFPRRDILLYLNEYFYKWLEVWIWYHDKGLLPYDKSWYNHPKKIIKVLELFENAYNVYSNQKVADITNNTKAPKMNIRK